MSDSETPIVAEPEAPKSNVIPFRSRKQLEDDSDQKDTIEILEGVLEGVKKGDITSVAVATTTKQGGTGAAWSPSNSLELMVAAVSVLDWKLHRLREEIVITSKPPLSS